MQKYLRIKQIPCLNFFFGTFLVLFLLSSCKVTEPPNTRYFNNLLKDTSFTTATNKYTEFKIRKNDQLGIVIASSSREEDALFNAPASSGSTSAIGGSSSSGYAVDANGNIQIHKLGEIKVEGMTRRELKAKLQKDLLPYLKDPIVNVSFLNHKITLLGEIKSPRSVNMPQEQMSILEVLAEGGDVSELARRDNVLIIRETETGKQTKYINLEDKAIFNSPWYYLQPDDVVYISPSDYKMTEAKRLRKQQTLTIATSVVSLALVVYNLFIK